MAVVHSTQIQSRTDFFFIPPEHQHKNRSDKEEKNVLILRDSQFAL